MNSGNNGSSSNGEVQKENTSVEGHHQPPHYAEEKPYETVRKSEDPSVAHNSYPHAPEYSNVPEETYLPSQALPPYAPPYQQGYSAGYQNGYPQLNPWSNEAARVEAIKKNDLITSLVGSVGLILAFSILGVFGAYLSAVGCAILMCRSAKLGGGYRRGLTCTIISLVVAQIFTFILLLAIHLSGMSLFEFIEAYVEHENGQLKRPSTF